MSQEVTKQLGEDDVVTVKRGRGAPYKLGGNRWAGRGREGKERMRVGGHSSSEWGLPTCILWHEEQSGKKRAPVTNRVGAGVVQFSSWI